MNFIHRIVPVCMMLFTFAGMAENCGSLPNPSGPMPIVEIASAKGVPVQVLSIQSPDASGILGGFEGGTVVRAGNRYHAFMTEMMQAWDSGFPFNKTRLADWVSQDGIHWHRVGTLFTSTSDFTGNDPRAALWAPMPIYNSAARRWNLFYVSYRAKPNAPPAWYLNYDGELVRAVSQVQGRAGIDGPYHDAGVIMRPGPDSDPWEGLQGVDSVYPYQANGRWFTFYGSSDTQRELGSWQVGLASAPELSGPWKRCSSLNPVPLGHFVENPIVSKIGNTYVAIYDDLSPQHEQSIGYTASLDGVHWGPGKQLVLFPGKEAHVRTPLALLPNADGTFDLFVTALSATEPSNSGKAVTAEGLYLLKVRVSLASNGKS
ncbi:MAG TPA: hypothetical protein VGN16_16390 [Acidobacteriaceae bacterium]|jgi:hypothetical protein